MPSTWAPNDWIAGDSLTHTRLNNIGNSIRTWGYGETAGTVTVNANQNALSALGVLTFHSSGYVSGKLPMRASTLGSTATNEQLARDLLVPTGGSAAYLEEVAYRASSGSDHSSADILLRRRVDASLMGYFGLGSGYADMGYHIAGVPTTSVRILSDGSIQMRLGGTLKTLSVDGSGFVKAT